MSPFQLPYHFDRTGVRVLAMCPGVTDTSLISEAHHRQLRQDWGDEAGRELDELPMQKWVHFMRSGLSYRIPKNTTFHDTVAVNF
jgi:NAD(P)-dependent dehydrogenase (short-subunit alcohol dehydrogenase family)